MAPTRSCPQSTIQGSRYSPAATAFRDGWFGKPWALQRAQEHATGDWLIFIDADVRLAPTAVSRVVGYGERNGLGMLTGFGTLTMESFWEHILQPAVGGLILLGKQPG